MSATENHRIASIILEQMQYGYERKVILGSWGFQKPSVIERGLRFKVNGALHKGYVDVTLNGCDLYDFRLFRATPKRGIVEVNSGKDIYFDNLVEVLDRYIETK